MFHETLQNEVDDVHCLEYVYSMIPLCIQSTLLYETVQVEVCRMERIARGKRSESVSAGIK
jgi:hypothetical protein